MYTKPLRLFLAASAGFLVICGLGYGYWRNEAETRVFSAIFGHQADLVWRPDQNPETRPMEQWTRQKIAHDYSQAWKQWHICYLTADSAVLYSYFSPRARKLITTDAFDFQAQGLQVHQRDSTHHLTLHFYALDGQIVSFTDNSLSVSQSCRSKATQKLIFNQVRQGTYEVLMALEEGHWRIQQLVLK